MHRRSRFEMPARDKILEIIVAILRLLLKESGPIWQVNGCTRGYRHAFKTLISYAQLLCLTFHMKSRAIYAS
jgi:hypothetical protein